jgi:hypothetical protein
MSTVEANELSDVLNRVKDWPPAARITLGGKGDVLIIDNCR